MRRIASLAIVGVMIVSGLIIIPDHSQADGVPAHILAPGDPNLLAWWVGGHETTWSWLKVSLDSTNFIQINLAVLDNIGVVSADTKDNSSVTASTLVNVDQDEAYFNFSVSNAGQTGSFVHKFTRETDVFGEPYVLHHAWTNASTSYVKFNVTVIRLNMWSDANFSYPWGLDMHTWTNKHFLWQVADRSDTGYHAFMFPNEKMLITESNTGNFANIINKADYNVAVSAGYIGSHVLNKTWAKWYDADGDLFTAMKLIAPNTYKLRGGNWLNLLPVGNYAELYAFSYNSTLFQRAAAYGVTHINLETFLISPGTYYFTNASVSAAVWRIRNLTHLYGMQLILPSYWKDFVTGVGAPITTYTYSNRVKILNAWNNYTARFGPITDEFSIGYGDFNGLTWNYWNWDMQETAFNNLSGKDLTIWSYQLWYMDEQVCYLNTEDWASWYLDYMDTYNWSSDPSYEMMGQKTVSFDMRVTSNGDAAALWTYQNESFEDRLTKESYQHGWGLCAFYNETFYANRLGFSFAIDYMNGLRYEMSLVVRGISSTVNGTQYEDGSYIAVMADEITGDLAITVVLNKTSQAYFTANAVDNDASDTYDAVVTVASAGYPLVARELGVTYLLTIYSPQISGLIKMAYTMVVLGVVVSVAAGGMMPFVREKNMKPGRAIRILVNTVIYIIISVAMLGALYAFVVV